MDWDSKIYNVLAESYNNLDAKNEYVIEKNWDFDYSCSVAINLVNNMITKLEDQVHKKYFTTLLSVLEHIRNAKFLKSQHEKKYQSMFRLAHRLADCDRFFQMFKREPTSEVELSYHKIYSSLASYYRQFDRWANKNIDPRFLHTVTNYVYNSLKTIGVGLVEDLDDDETEQLDEQ